MALNMWVASRNRRRRSRSDHVACMYSTRRAGQLVMRLPNRCEQCFASRIVCSYYGDHRKVATILPAHCTCCHYRGINPAAATHKMSGKHLAPSELKRPRPEQPHHQVNNSHPTEASSRQPQKPPADIHRNLQPTSTAGWYVHVCWTGLSMRAGSESTWMC
jgi:hypothetical protein